MCRHVFGFVSFIVEHCFAAQSYLKKFVETEIQARKAVCPHPPIPVVTATLKKEQKHLDGFIASALKSGQMEMNF